MPLIASRHSSSVAKPLKITISAAISRVFAAGAEGWARMVADIAGHFGFSQPEVYAVYAANDLEAVTADAQSFSAENFAPDLPGMTMPILLLAGTKDGDYLALKAATDKLPNATFASLWIKTTPRPSWKRTWFWSTSPSSSPR